MLLSSGGSIFKLYNIKTKIATESKHVTVYETVFPAKANRKSSKFKKFDSELFHEEESECTEGDTVQVEEEEDIGEEERAQKFETDVGDGPEDDGEEVLPRYPMRERSDPDRYIANVSRALCLGHNGPDSPT